MKTVMCKLFDSMNGPRMMKQQENYRLELSGMCVGGVKKTEFALCGGAAHALAARPAVDWPDDAGSRFDWEKSSRS